jgi:hypothetical protein
MLCMFQNKWNIILKRFPIETRASCPTSNQTTDVLVAGGYTTNEARTNHVKIAVSRV